MKSDKQSSDSISSTATYSTSTIDMETFCKQMLKTRIFLGHFKEKRYANDLNAYRDLIVINPNETEFSHDIEIVRNRITNFYKTKSIWFGYTSTKLDDVLSPTPHCIWTDLDASIPFGHYWFQVKTLRFKDDEVMIKIKMLRPLRKTDKTTDEQLFYTENQSHAAEDDDDDQPFNKTLRIAGSLIEFLQIWWDDLYKTILHALSVHCNAENTIYFIKYVSILFVAFVTSMLYAVKYLGYFTIHFMAQSRELIRVMTPIILKLIDLLNKIIGGFFILLAMIWRDCLGGSRTTVPPIRYQSIMPNSANRYNNNNDRRNRFYSQ